MKHKITIEKSPQSRIHEVDFDNIPFGRIFTDHMFVSDYCDGEWQNCRIMPFQKLTLHPSVTALHYGQAIFEGLKGYRDTSGDPQLFRPEMNAKRFNKSAVRMAMPEVPEELFMEALIQLVSLDRDWIPVKPGSSLYLRPYMFSNDEYVGIKPADNFKFIIFACPVGQYYPEPVKVLIADKYVRAFPGGVGAAKAAGNYAATLLPVKEARDMGYDQILWIDGVEFKYVQEIGTMNVFFQIGDKVITPSTDKGTILEGITRDSVLSLLRDQGVSVEVRDIEVEELHQAYKDGTLLDAFGTGTAATISHISVLGYKGIDMELPAVEDRHVSNAVKYALEDIKLSKVPDPYGWVVKVDQVLEANAAEEQVQP